MHKYVYINFPKASELCENKDRVFVVISLIIDKKAVDGKVFKNYIANLFSSNARKTIELQHASLK